jgi:hypothetical protein
MEHLHDVPGGGVLRVDDRPPVLRLSYLGTPAHVQDAHFVQFWRRGTSWALDAAAPGVPWCDSGRAIRFRGTDVLELLDAPITTDPARHGVAVSTYLVRVLPARYSELLMRVDWAADPAPALQQVTEASELTHGQWSALRLAYPEVAAHLPVVFDAPVT